MGTAGPRTASSLEFRVPDAPRRRRTPDVPVLGAGAAQSIEDAAVLTDCLAADPKSLRSALLRYESLRIERTTRIQNVSHGRAHINHLPDGPDQEARDVALAAADPLVTNGWIYSYDP
jgi:salicylate hydroxylase